MASTFRADKQIKDEATQIASQLGMSINTVINILLRQFVENRGFVLPVRLTPEREKTVIDMTSEEFEAACREAVAKRTANPQMDYVTMLDEDSGQIIKKYKDGRVEYVVL